MLTIKEINQKVQKEILGGAKVPHGISNPVICKDDDKYYVAYFVYVYNKKNMDSGLYQRPVQWALVDLSSGDIAKVYECKERDFSTQSHEKLYSLIDDNVKHPDESYFEVMDDLFDTVRASLLYGKALDMESYKAYINSLMAITPNDYRVFYRDLSI